MRRKPYNVSENTRSNHGKEIPSLGFEENGLPELYRAFLELGGLEAVPSEVYRPYRLKYFSRIEAVVSLMEKEFPDPAGVRIGDFGSGRGMITRVLARRGYDMLAIDTDEGRMESLRTSASGAGIECIKANIEELDYPEGSLDAALSVELVEHCAWPEEITRKILHYVRPGGILIITTPNGSRLGARLLLRLPSLNQVRRMKSRASLEARQFDTDDHVLRIKLRELEGLVPSDGEVVDRGYFGVSGVLFNRPTYYLLRLLPIGWVIASTRILPRVPLLNAKTASKVYVVIRKRRQAR
jgi:2-polyprenyl-3-methyl-5-hydroxy-6-metoxy-1,4-benzoquinol methylase